MMDYSVFDNMIEGIQVINDKWQYVYVNNAVIKQAKISKEELIGSTMMEKYPGIEHTDMFNCLSSCMKKRNFDRMLNEFTFPDGSKGWFELRMEPIKDGVLIMSFDVTEQKKLELKLKEMNETLEAQVNKKTKELEKALNYEKELNQLKSSFVSMASHELRTPLSIILSCIYLAEEHKTAEQQDVRKKHFSQMRSSINNMVNILNEFLSLDQIKHGKINTEPEKFNVEEHIQTIIKELNELCKDGQDINLINNGSKTIVTDKNILRNIIINLLSNAIKYSEDNIRIDISEKNEQLIINITDHGIGIPKEQQKELFSEFFRAENTTGIQGTGLGLYIVNNHIKLLGGSIEYVSKENKGTTFRVTLPKHNLEEKSNLVA